LSSLAASIFLATLSPDSLISSAPFSAAFFKSEAASAAALVAAAAAASSLSSLMFLAFAAT